MSSVERNQADGLRGAVEDDLDGVAHARRRTGDRSGELQEDSDVVGGLHRHEVDVEHALELHSSRVASPAAKLTQLASLYGPSGPRRQLATRTRLFRPLDEADLQRLDDDALVDYMRRARTAGHPSAALALAIMVYGHWPNVERRIRLKVPEGHVEDLTGDVIADAIASAFDGTSVGEFVSWLGTITRRAIADFHRRGLGRVRVEELPAVEPEAPSEAGAVEVGDAIERVIATLRDEHRRVVDIVVFEGRTAADAVREVPGITEANAHKIASRFRRALRGELEVAENTGSG